MNATAHALAISVGADGATAYALPCSGTLWPEVRHGAAKLACLNNTECVHVRTRFKAEGTFLESTFLHDTEYA
jgi:hypothetical protein